MMEGTIFQYDYIFKGILACFLASITAGIAGTYIVSRRIVFLSGGITHASFGGIGIGYYAGISPVAGAALFGILSALGIEYLSVKHKIREDSAIGIIWALGMATGIIFIYLTPGYTPNLLSYLFGSILTVTKADLISLGLLALLLIFYFSVFYRTILYISFDENYARTYSSYVDFFKYLTSSMIALTIVLNIRMAGVILVLSLLTIPPNIAMLFTRKYASIMKLAVLFSFAGTTGGYLFSWYTNIPAGAATIIVLVFLWLILKFITTIFVKRGKENQI